MKREDWACSECGEMMIKTSWPYMACPNSHGKLHPVWSVGDLPRARRIDYRRFAIEGGRGYWEYVPHAHRGSLTRPPLDGFVVARLLLACGCMGNPHQRPMTFRPCSAPGRKK